MPTQEMIEAAIERNKYRWEPIKRENLFNKKEYRFKLRESATLINAFPDIYIRIKSVEKGERLNEVIGQTIANFNVDSESKDNVNGLIHDFDSKKVKKDVYLFHVDTGSGAIEAVEEILKGLHVSDLVIELISLE